MKVDRINASLTNKRWPARVAQLQKASWSLIDHASTYLVLRLRRTIVLRASLFPDRSLDRSLVENIHKNLRRIKHTQRKNRDSSQLYNNIVYAQSWMLTLSDRSRVFRFPVCRRRCRREIKLHKTPASVASMVALRERFALRCRDGD